MKKTTAAMIAITLLTIGSSMGVFANGFEEFNDYINEDGTYSYYFDQGITITMSEEWYQNTIVNAYVDRVIVCHKDSYEKWAEKGQENGGRLFTVAYSVNHGFKDLDEMTYIGYDEEEMLNYYVTKPTDYQAYAQDPEMKAKYDNLFSTSDDVIANIKINSNEIVASGEVTLTGRAPSSELYTIVGTDLFSFECSTNWYTESLGGGMIAKKSEDAETFDIPEIMVFPVYYEGTLGDEVVKIKNAYLDTYKNRIASQPEILTYEVPGTDRKLAGVRVQITGEDAMETITRVDLLEELNGQSFEYSCAYISNTHIDGAQEDETTFFEYMHAIDTMEKYQ